MRASYPGTREVNKMLPVIRPKVSQRSIPTYICAPDRKATDSLTKPAGDVGFSPFVMRIGKNLSTLSELHENAHPIRFGH